MSGSTFKLLCDTRSQYLPPLKRDSGISTSPDDGTADTLWLSMEKTDTFVSKYTFIPITKDLSGEVKQSISFLTRLKDINWEIYHPSRAGIIPYYKTATNIYFCLGEDTTSQQLADFGGGVEFSETSLEGALREFQEETLGIFGKLLAEDLQERLVVTSRQAMIIFCPVAALPEVYVEKFERAKVRVRDLEVSHIYWLTQHQVQGLIDDVSLDSRVKLYYKVKTILSSVFSHLVKLL